MRERRFTLRKSGPSIFLPELVDLVILGKKTMPANVEIEVLV